jgi:membrane protease YdiL (CAAX protease family)
MHISNGFIIGNHPAKYLAGILLVFILTSIGGFPHILAIGIDQVSKMSPTEIMTYLSPEMTLFFMLLPFLFTLAGVMIATKFIHYQSITNLTTGRRKVDTSRIAFAFCLWSLVSVVLIVFSYFSSPSDFVVTFQPGSFLILCVMTILLVPIQTSAEEYLFRGYLMQGLALLARNRWVPLLITSVLFGLLHISNPEVGKMGNIILIYYIGSGLLLGIMTLMDDGMELALGFHAANNITGILLLTSDWSAFQTPSVLKSIAEPKFFSEVLFPVFILFPLVLIIFARKYKWTDWKQKLSGKIVTHAQNPNAI